ncbi:hypothetical protein HO173_000804 [Letharia columbiana]|uniref:Uncharacterized protein n=1 Tax=Letharia columbiana TaxID=112416 RepID=A0A8H6L9R8_9LECA|nr:uncharacterized protein HO173_000804 [Letharia columbiana]KAF6241010.1 hypothetical protein HO173_000804 [Letharia columbiana]
MRRYGMSKTLMVLFMYELQRRLAGTKYSDISVLAVDSGALGGSGLFKESPAALRFVLYWMLAPLAVVTTILSPNGNFRNSKEIGERPSKFQFRRRNPGQASESCLSEWDCKNET